MTYTNVLRQVRRRAERAGFVLERFQRRHDGSDKGIEWFARPLRFSRLSVIVWQAIGRNDIREAKEMCDEVIVAERTACGNPSIAYGISWRGKWPQI